MDPREHDAQRPAAASPGERRQPDPDAVDEPSIESFPASDPPARTAATGAATREARPADAEPGGADGHPTQRSGH